MDQICYLCGVPIAETKMSGDHTIPKHLIMGKRPKVKGFDYGGKILTHPKCNNQFGPETYCCKALDVIAALDDENCVSMHRHKDDPSIEMMALNSEYFKSFTYRDLRFFKIIDARERNLQEFSFPSFFSGKPRTNLIRHALFVALAVLTKSAAALLVARHLGKPPSCWHVLAISYSGATEAVDFDDLFGSTKPFDIGVKIWLRPLSSDDWLAIYRVRNILVFFLFRFSDSNTIWNGMIELFSDAERWSFEGTRLTELIDYQWQRV